MIEVRMTGVGPTGFAPLAAVFHDGSFDFFDAGGTASAALELLAEEGGPGDLLGTAPGSANAGPVFGNNPAPGPPIFTPGGTGSFVFTVDDTNTNFSFASMLLPSNDWFIGNDDPTAYDISSLINAANGTELVINASTVWDAGTESEDFAFSPGNPLIGVPDGDAAGGDTAGGTISALSGTDPFAGFANAPAGFDSTAFDFSGGDVATITLTVVPEPSATLLGGLAAGGLLLRRRRK